MVQCGELNHDAPLDMTPERMVAADGSGRVLHPGKKLGKGTKGKEKT